MLRWPIVTSDARLRLDVGALLDRPGASRPLREHLAVPGTSASPAFDADIDLMLSGLAEGIGVFGSVRGVVATVCSRCLESLVAPVEAEVRELYLAPGEETADAEAYALEGRELDLEPLIRDTLALTLPAYPRCDDDCKGLCPACGVNRNDTTCTCSTTTTDPRLRALADLPMTRKD